MLKPGVKDSVVAHPVLAVHDEDRVGREATHHLVKQHIIVEPTPSRETNHQKNCLTWPSE